MPTPTMLDRAETKHGPKRNKMLPFPQHGEHVGRLKMDALWVEADETEAASKRQPTPVPSPHPAQGVTQGSHTFSQGHRNH